VRLDKAMARRWDARDVVQCVVCDAGRGVDD